MRLSLELKLVRKNICSLKKELENVNSTRVEAHERVYEYQSLMTLVKELAQKEDVRGLQQVRDTQVCYNFVFLISR